MTAFGGTGAPPDELPTVDVPPCSWPAFAGWAVRLAMAAPPGGAVVVMSYTASARVVITDTDGHLTLHVGDKTAQRKGAPLGGAQPYSGHQLADLIRRHLRVQETSETVLQLGDRRLTPRQRALVDAGPQRHTAAVAETNRERRWVPRPQPGRTATVLQQQLDPDQVEALQQLRERLPP